MDGRSITTGSAPGRPMRKSVAKAVARKAPAAALPYSNPMVRCPCWLASNRHLARWARYSFKPRISSRRAMSWPCVSTNTKMGISPPLATTRSTSCASGSAPAVPSAAPFATPITAITSPCLRFPVPIMIPAVLVFTSWPEGKRPLRTSSSVMVGFLDAGRECSEILAVHIPDRLGIFDTQNPPHRNGVIARTEPRLTRGEPFLLRLQCFEIEDRHFSEERLSRGAKSFHGILGKSIGSADQPAVLAAVGAPDQGFVFGVELLDAFIGLDHFRAGHRNPPLLGYRDLRTSRRGQPSAAECTCLAADQRDDCHARAASLDDGTH